MEFRSVSAPWGRRRDAVSAATLDPPGTATRPWRKDAGGSSGSSSSAERVKGDDRPPRAGSTLPSFARERRAWQTCPALIRGQQGGTAGSDAPIEVGSGGWGGLQIGWARRGARSICCCSCRLVVYNPRSSSSSSTSLPHGAGGLTTQSTTAVRSSSLSLSSPPLR